MNVVVLATIFGVIFVSELPDKTPLASLVLGAHYRSGQLFVGVAAAFALHVLLALAAGGLLGLLPHRVMEATVAVLFVLGAVLMLRRREDEDTVGDQRAERQDTETPKGRKRPSNSPSPASPAPPGKPSCSWGPPDSTSCAWKPRRRSTCDRGMGSREGTVGGELTETQPPAAQLDLVHGLRPAIDRAHRTPPCAPSHPSRRCLRRSSLN